MSCQALLHVGSLAQNIVVALYLSKIPTQEREAEEHDSDQTLQ